MDVKNRKVWFRLKHKAGKISKIIHELDTNHATIEARVYANNNDAENDYLANAFATRYFNPEDKIFGKKFVELAEVAATDAAAFTKLVEKVPSENFLLYETWGRKAGNKMLEELGLTNESMTFALYEAYKKMGEKLNVPVSHVGLNFYDIYCNHPEIDLYNPDLTHPSYEGTCLGALTHYHSIFGEFPENTASLKLGDEVISVFKNTVLASKC